MNNNKGDRKVSEQTFGPKLELESILHSNTQRLPMMNNLQKHLGAVKDSSSQFRNC
jgi:hypothetical protein